MDTLVWTNVTAVDGPGARSFASAWLSGTSMYLVSGCLQLPASSLIFDCALYPEGVGGANDMWMLDLTTMAWDQLKPTGVWPVGMSALSTLTDTQMLAYYIAGDEETSALVVYDTQSNVWTSIAAQSLGAVPEGRTGVSLVDSNEEGVYYLYGGSCCGV